MLDNNIWNTFFDLESCCISARLELSTTIISSKNSVILSNIILKPLFGLMNSVTNSIKIMGEEFHIEDFSKYV